jgi:hypothetical protein
MNSETTAGQQEQVNDAPRTKLGSQKKATH